MKKRSGQSASAVTNYLGKTGILLLSGLVFLLIISTTASGAGGRAIMRVSTDSNGNQGNGVSVGGTISPDGRFILFSSQASNLVPDDSNDLFESFIKDTQTGATSLISTDSSGNPGNGNSLTPSITADNRFVVFSSMSDNLVPGDSNGALDVFIKDTQTGVTSLISKNSAGVQGNGNSAGGPVSADGRYVAFTSNATNLAPGSGDGTTDDVFRKDTQTGNIVMVSTDSTGNRIGNSWSPSMSADGRHVIFQSYTGGTNIVFYKDVQTGAATVVSTDSDGNPANGPSFSGSISASGRYVSFSSYADNLVPNDSNGFIDVFLKDLQTGSTYLVSTGADGNQGNSASSGGSVSYDGRYVAFGSGATNLISGDGNGEWDVFLKDLQTGIVTRVSTDVAGNEGNNSSGRGYSPVISARGSDVVFVSEASNLVSGDTNETSDVFLYRAAAPVPESCPGDATLKYSNVLALPGYYTNSDLSAQTRCGKLTIGLGLSGR